MNQTFYFFIHLGLQRAAFLPLPVAPRFFKHRGRRLPGNGQVVFRYLVIRHYAKIPKIVAQPATHHAPGLQPGHQVVQASALIYGQGTHVKPNLGNGSVPRHQLLHLSQIELVMFRSERIGVVPRHGVRQGEVPVNEREVHAKGYPACLAGLGKFSQQVPAVRRGFHNVEGGVTGMVHAKAVVVFGREDNGLHSGLFGQGHYPVRVPLYGVELCCRCFVFLARNICKRLYLLAVPARNGPAFVHTAVRRIQPKMNEHGILLVQPLLRRLAVLLLQFVLSCKG